MNVKEVYIYMFPGIMYVWLFFLAQGSMQEILDEREAHTLQRLLAAPVSVIEFLLSKVIRCFILCVAIQCLLLMVSAGLFDIHWGSPWLLIPAVLACALSVTGVLAFICALAQTKMQAHSLSAFVILVCALVGGSFFPFEEMPEFLQAVGRFSPNHWGTVAFHAVTWSQPLMNLVKPVVFLCAVGMVGSAAAIALLRRRLAAGGR